MKALWVGFALFFMGCTFLGPSTISTNSVGSQYEYPVDVVRGKAVQHRVLIVLGFGDNSVQAAISEALLFRKADTLSNVFVDRRATCYPICLLPIYIRIETTVMGTLVKYQGEGFMGKERFTVDLNNLDNERLLQALIKLMERGDYWRMKELLDKVSSELKESVFEDIKIRRRENKLTKDEEPLYRWLVQEEYLKAHPKDPPELQLRAPRY